MNWSLVVRGTWEGYMERLQDHAYTVFGDSVQTDTGIQAWCTEPMFWGTRKLNWEQQVRDFGDLTGGAQFDPNCLTDYEWKIVASGHKGENA